MFRNIGPPRIFDIFRCRSIFFSVIIIIIIIIIITTLISKARLKDLGEAGEAGPCKCRDRYSIQVFKIMDGGVGFCVHLVDWGFFFSAVLKFAPEGSASLTLPRS